MLRSIQNYQKKMQVEKKYKNCQINRDIIYTHQLCLAKINLTDRNTEIL